VALIKVSLVVKEACHYRALGRVHSPFNLFGEIITRMKQHLDGVNRALKGADTASLAGEQIDGNLSHLVGGGYADRTNYYTI
jgi:hypothetical protein